jgi:hypothetical protein
LVPSIGTGRIAIRIPERTRNDPNNLPNGEAGTISPYHIKEQTNQKIEIKQ